MMLVYNLIAIHYSVEGSHSLCMCVHMCACVRVCVSACMRVCLSVCQSICLSVFSYVTVRCYFLQLAGLGLPVEVAAASTAFKPFSIVH